MQQVNKSCISKKLEEISIKLTPQCNFIHYIGSYQFKVTNFKPLHTTEQIPRILFLSHWERFLDNSIII